MTKIGLFVLLILSLTACGVHGEILVNCVEKCTFETNENLLLASEVELPEFQYANVRELCFGYNRWRFPLQYDSELQPPVYYEEINVFIPWRFSVYTEPDFRSPRIESFEAQFVVILERCSNYYGWALIDTELGEYWTYLNSNRRFIGRRRGLYDNIGYYYPVAFIEGEIVDILDWDNEWILIDNSPSPLWLYLNFLPSTYDLDIFMNQFGNAISVYFRNVETGFYYTHNPNRRYFSASVTKASYALYIYQKAERGEIDLDSYITFTHVDFLGGSGVIRYRYTIGTPISQRELLRKNLMYSDNIATLMLRREHGIRGYQQFVDSLGANPNNVGDNVFNSFLNVLEAGIFMRAIYTYIESDGYFSDEFRQHLLNNQHPFIVSNYPVASKSGWTYPYAWHDMAIVYAPSPFILVILSRGRSGTCGDYKVFEDISRHFQEFNHIWFATETGNRLPNNGSLD